MRFRVLFFGLTFVRVATAMAQADPTVRVGSAGRLDAGLTYWISIPIPREERPNQNTLAAKIGKLVSLFAGATAKTFNGRREMINGILSTVFYGWINLHTRIAE